MIDIARKTPVVEGLAPDQIPFDEILTQQRPTIFRGMARDWPLVRAGLTSPRAAMDYLLAHDRGERFVGYTGAPEIKGRFGYDADVTRLNFQTERTPLAAFLERIEQQLDVADGPSLYIGSSDIDAYLPGLRARTTWAWTWPPWATRRRWPASGSATARSPRPTTTCPTTSPAAWSAGGGSRCFRPTRSTTSIRARWT
jgi:hypothetical protein